ncbi:hypothetical protein L1887_07942 [Cichorium endivia]|nr:hypothetical protein L1887_07942 [Cichorium endivia]
MAFDKYLKKIAAHPVIRTSEELRVFLQAQGNLLLAKTTIVASRMMSPPRGVWENPKKPPEKFVCFPSSTSSSLENLDSSISVSSILV